MSENQDCPMHGYFYGGPNDCPSCAALNPTTPAPSAEETLRSFVRWLIDECHDQSEICVGDIQDEAVRRGLLIETEVTERCGESCACAEYGDEFPTDCLKYGPALLSPRPAEEGKKL